MGGGLPIKAFGNDTCPHGSGEWAVHNVFTEYLHIYKVHTYLITAFAQVVREIANTRLLFLGDGELKEELSGQVETLGLVHHRQNVEANCRSPFCCYSVISPCPLWLIL